MTQVVVAMSGGVDSSVAAAILKSRGWDVVGIMLRLWSEPDCEDSNRCCTPDAIAMARRVAAKLEIPFYVIDAKQLFRDVVVSYFLDGYASGFTPNPCLVCNRYIRWDFLLKHVLAMGIKYLATGHYARIELSEDCSNGEGTLGLAGKGCPLDQEKNHIHLLRGVDPQKDQSYVLSVLTQEQLLHAIFPIGDLTKPQVRQLARQYNLPVAERAESQDLCFLGDNNYRQFLVRYAPEVIKPGLITTRDGNQIGKHDGLAFYTIGQRKGLGVPSSRPMYVIDKDLQTNRLIVGYLDELGRQVLTANKVNWICGVSPSKPFQAQVKIRYKATDVVGLVTPLDNARVQVHFSDPLRDITPGQLAVFYDGETSLGSGFIEI